MPKKARQINKKQRNAVQNLSAENYTKTPQNTKPQQSRAKFACNTKLEEMIRLANLLPKGSHFDLLEAFEKGHSPSLYWLETLKNLPSELFWEIIVSRELTEYIKQDSIEYWENNSGIAQNYLADLESDGEITDNEFNQLINSDEEMIARFLVDKGYFGENYSYREQSKRQKEKEEYDLWLKSDDDCGYEDSKLDFVSSNHSAYMRALMRFQKIRDFLFGLTKLAEYCEAENLKTDNTVIGKNETQTIPNSEFDRLVAEKIKDELMTSSVVISKDGVVNFFVSEWAEAIQDVNISRLRICEICEKFFWATRKDSFACSKKHSKVRQMRLLRENWNDKGGIYLTARQKKANKEREKKQNGSL